MMETGQKNSDYVKELFGKFFEMMKEGLNEKNFKIKNQKLKSEKKNLKMENLVLRKEITDLQQEFKKISKNKHYRSKSVYNSKKSTEQIQYQKQIKNLRAKNLYLYKEL